MKLLDIKTEKFNEVVRSLRGEQWRKTHEYQGFDAWIDYGMITLERDGVTVTCEWTNWEEGSIEAPDALLADLKRRFSL